MRAIAILLTAIPFAFALLRLITTGNDARYLYTAIASTVGAAAVLLYSRGDVAPSVSRIVLAAVVALCCAVAAAALVGARNGPAIAIVCAGFAACSTVGIGLLLRSRTTRAELPHS